MYRDRDTRLKREVALKILPEGFATDPEQARFRREAEVLASLSHPNIAAIYGIEEGPAQAGHHVRALVMELVDGRRGLAKLIGPPESGHYVQNGRGVRLQPDLTASPNIASPAMMTSAGVLLGTAAYMSAEQARGKPLDKRSDIGAFGCVLCEMLAGRTAYRSDSVVEGLAGV